MRQLLYVILIAVTFIASRAETGYYPSTINGLKGAELKAAVAQAIASHRQIASTAELKQLLTSIDAAPDGTITAVFDESPLNMVNDYVGVINPAHYGDSSPYMMQLSYDLHCIVPCTSATHDAIADYPPDIVTTTNAGNNALKVGLAIIDGIATNAYEPTDSVKGDVARMIMYAVTCYSGYKWQGRALNIINGGAYPTLNRHGITLLLEWHRADAVSQREKKRNDAIYSFQGNRNPFIDFPELAEHLWGTKTDEPFSIEGTSDPHPSEPDTDCKLKSTYSKTSDSTIVLATPFVSANAEWSIDGTKCTTPTIDVASLALGRHILRFKTTTLSGRITIEIVP